MNQSTNSGQNSSNNDSCRNNHQEDFLLDGATPEHEDFSLESDTVEAQLDHEPVQNCLILNIEDSEKPELSAQIDLDGMDKPVHRVLIEASAEPPQTVSFQHAQTLLESLEAQNITVNYQCREGYCGSCRTQLLEGEVHYTEEPMAWINDDEILPCCCIPKTAIRIKLI
ncbi:MAG: ferredoxin [Oleispira sp.]|jgi:ferredoxin